jgi:sigma-B regulation protein RsbU (phosphoserine phosphatase)
MTNAQQLLACQFPASADRMGGIRLKLRAALGRTGLGDNAVQDLVLAVGEACMNIMQHAYGDQDRGDIVLEVELVKEPGKEPGKKEPGKESANRQEKQGKPGKQGMLVFRLTDFAKHKSSRAEMLPRPLDEIRPGGLGCHIINQVMDEVVLLDQPGLCGNVLEMRKRL